VPYTRSITDNLLLDVCHLETHFSVALLTHLSVSLHCCFLYPCLTNLVTVQKYAREIIMRYSRLIKITYYRMVICNCYKNTDTTITSIRMHNAYASSIFKASTLQMDVTGFSETSVNFWNNTSLHPCEWSSSYWRWCSWSGTIELVSKFRAQHSQHQRIKISSFV